jgi:DeoR family glycerol-3-phosphate regulon repressor
MNVANILVGNDSCEVMVAGGVLRRSDGGLVGDLTAQFIEQFKVDFAVIGASALDEDGDLLDFDLQEVRVSQTLIRRARQTYLVCDASKFQRKAPVRIVSLRDIDRLFTDRPLAPALAALCADWGTGVTVAA